MCKQVVQVKNPEEKVKKCIIIIFLFPAYLFSNRKSEQGILFI